MGELLTRFAHRRGVDQRNELSQVRHQQLVEQGFVRVLQRRQINIFFEVLGFLTELPVAPDLEVLRIDAFRDEARPAPARAHTR